MTSRNSAATLRRVVSFGGMVRTGVKTLSASKSTMRSGGVLYMSLMELKFEKEDDRIE